MFNLDRWLSFVFRRISSQIYEDWCLHWRDWTQPGFRAVVVYRFGARLLGSQKRGVLNRLLILLHRMMYRFIRNYYGIDLPAKTIVGRRLLIGHQGGIVIHPRRRDRRRLCHSAKRHNRSGHGSSALGSAETREPGSSWSRSGDRRQSQNWR